MAQNDLFNIGSLVDAYKWRKEMDLKQEELDRNKTLADAKLKEIQDAAELKKQQTEFSMLPDYFAKMSYAKSRGMTKEYQDALKGFLEQAESVDSKGRAKMMNLGMKIERSIPGADENITWEDIDSRKVDGGYLSRWVGKDADGNPTTRYLQTGKGGNGVALDEIQGPQSWESAGKPTETKTPLTTDESTVQDAISELGAEGGNRSLPEVRVAARQLLADKKVEQLKREAEASKRMPVHSNLFEDQWEQNDLPEEVQRMKREGSSKGDAFVVWQALPEAEKSKRKKISTIEGDRAAKPTNAILGRSLNLDTLGATKNTYGSLQELMDDPKAVILPSNAVRTAVTDVVSGVSNLEDMKYYYSKIAAKDAAMRLKNIPDNIIKDTIANDKDYETYKSLYNAMGMALGKAVQNGGVVTEADAQSGKALLGEVSPLGFTDTSETALSKFDAARKFFLNRVNAVVKQEGKELPDWTTTKFSKSTFPDRDKPSGKTSGNKTTLSPAAKAVADKFKRKVKE